MKKKIFIIFLITVLILAISVCVFIVFINNVKSGIYEAPGRPVSECGKQYEKNWISSDGNISVTIDSIDGPSGTGLFDGRYTSKTKEHYMWMIIDKDRCLFHIYDMNYKENIVENHSLLIETGPVYDIEENKFCLEVKKVFTDESVYNVGDVITFKLNI